MNQNDIIFLSETRAITKIMEEIKGYNLFGNPDVPIPVSHGGLAVYVKDDLAQYVNNIRYGKCTLSFNLSIIPNVFLMGVYIYPTDSKNYDITDYRICINNIRYWLEKGLTPFVGGDLNSRPGDLNKIATKSLKWRYVNNIDQSCNINGTQLGNMCELLQILPLNHNTEKILEKVYDGINPIREKNKIKREYVEENVDIEGKKCDELFQLYRENLNNSSEGASILYKNYQSQRNKLFSPATINIHNKYKVVIESQDDRKLWKLIDWSGNMKRTKIPKDHPSNSDFCEYFKLLYAPIVGDDYIDSLHSNIYIPVTDDAISMNELLESS